MLKKIKDSGSKKRLAVIGLIAIAVIVGGALAFRHFTANTAPAAPKGVNLAPATPGEKQEAQNNKDRIAASQKDGGPTTTPSTAPVASGKTQVNVLITSANSSMVTSYVTGAFEDGGTCTATFTQGATVVTRTSGGFKNVSYTQCPPITPNLPSGGSWSVVVTYSSNTSEGKSAAQNF